MHVSTQFPAPSRLFRQWKRPAPAHLIVAPQQLQRAAAVPGAPELRVHGDAHDPSAAQRWKVRVLELLAHRPGDEITLGAIQKGNLP